MEEKDILFEMDATISHVTEWQMWDIVRTMYEPDSIPRKIQLQCYRRYQTVAQQDLPIIFHSFQFHRLIHNFVDTHEGWMGKEFVFHDHVERPHTRLATLMLQNNPLRLITDFETTSIVYAGYDHLGERFVVMGADMDYIRGLVDVIEQEMKAQLPFLFMEAVAHYIAEEQTRKAEMMQLRIRIPQVATPKTPDMPSSCTASPAPSPPHPRLPQNEDSTPKEEERLPSTFCQICCRSFLPMLIGSAMRYLF